MSRRVATAAVVAIVSLGCGGASVDEAKIVALRERGVPAEATVITVQPLGPMPIG